MKMENEMMPNSKTNYTYPELVKRLYDMKQLTLPPAPDEKSGTFSSFDRRSVYNQSTELYEDWGANDDGRGFIRQEGDSIVVLEVDGPGVIWRVWSALAGKGHIRIFIDHGAEPIIDKPFCDFFETFSDEKCPSNFPNLLPTLSRGRNSFIPIPFQKHCKVILDKDWGCYYHFTHSIFPANVNIPSFNGSFDAESVIALADADRHFYLRGRSPDSTKTEAEYNHINAVSVPPKGSFVICDKAGSGAITMIKVKIAGIELESEENQKRILRELTISIKWDQDQTLSVWSPLGDFFGSAPGINPYRSLPLGMSSDTFYSYWYMPFSEGAHFELGNDGDQAREVTFEIKFVELPKLETELLLRFHAKWHRGNYQQLDQSRFAEGGDRWPDWPLLLVKGRGRFCGIHLHIYNAWVTPEEQPETWWYGRWDKKTIDWWWGEGDEKFFIDGEKFPSTFGTGSEDYIGYAWAAEPPFPMFDSALACQSFIELDANGHTSVNRFHISDNIPFVESFEGFIEKYKQDIWETSNKCLYAVTAYWYQMPRTEDEYRPIPFSERYGFYNL
jgi:hypothetical protein